MSQPAELGSSAERLERDFRRAMGHVAAPVSVVTTYAGGVPSGTTVSAFDSLSMRPPLMTIALQRSSHLLSVLTVGSRVGVNVLGSTQEAIALTFARRDEDRFAGVEWSLVDGVPRLDGTHAWIVLTVRERVAAGDHVVLIGDVVTAERGMGRPLTYHDRVFGTHRPHATEPESRAG
ncbi:flavin reductase [Intrasporangium oryzae NRRL B-24470]|uniref:Flavin reductase n=1 Tax=Intrasporangium oryzae NRRL B-24470 TaxID=1386089 RepID=W9G8H2_9MICO|nr:flavin reductase family protein [Intrasporangium oryzae]EWT00169.1 flavin reductase [Intrasporangium oryzae NRRL B-24470]